MARSRRWLIGCLLALPGPALGAEAPLLRTTPILEKVTGELQFGEGPLWHRDGYLLFEDMPRLRIMKLDAKGKITVFREPSGKANGLGMDARGRLIACEGGARRVSRTEKDGTVVTLADSYAGKKLNSPNDVAIDHKGRIYFTDPRYGDRTGVEQDKEAVYRIDADGTLTRIVDVLARPNGILVTPDGKTLVVSDNNAGTHSALMAFDLDGQGNARHGRVLFDFGTGRGVDGMTFDDKGRIWGTAGVKGKAGVYAFEFEGDRASVRQVAFVPTPEDPTNCTFGGKARDTLYVTTITSLYRIKLPVHGTQSPPGK